MAQRKSPPYPNAPLALTVLEIRYPELSDGIGRSAQHQMREVLRKELPLVEPSSTPKSLDLAATPLQHTRAFVACKHARCAATI